MLIRYEVLQLLESERGSLVEIRVAELDADELQGRRWLWIEASTVIVLDVVGNASPSRQAFNYAALAMEGGEGELCWASGHRDRLVLSSSRTLRPVHHHLVHQHLN